MAQSLRHVVYLSNLPTLNESITITINVPANMGDSIAVEMNFPVDILVDPNQLATATVTPVFSNQNATTASTSPPRPVFQSPETTQPVFEDNRPSKVPVNPPISSPMANILSGLSPDQAISPIATVATPKTISPGRQEFKSTNQAFLPSIGNVLNQPISQPALQQTISPFAQAYSNTTTPNNSPIIAAPVLQTSSIFSGQTTPSPFGLQNSNVRELTPQQNAEYVQSVTAALQATPGAAVLRPFGNPIIIQQPLQPQQMQATEQPVKLTPPTTPSKKTPAATRLSELLTSPAILAPRIIPTAPPSFGILNDQTLIGSDQQNQEDYLPAAEPLMDQNSSEDMEQGPEEEGAESSGEGLSEEPPLEPNSDEEPSNVESEEEINTPVPLPNNNPQLNTQNNQQPNNAQNITQPNIQSSRRLNCSATGSMLPAASFSPSCGMAKSEFQSVPVQAVVVFTERPYVGGQTQRPSSLLNNYSM